LSFFVFNQTGKTKQKKVKKKWIPDKMNESKITQLEKNFQFQTGERASFAMQF
jgi:hypothetical protein